MFAHNNALHCSDGTVRLTLATVSKLTPLAITLTLFATSLVSTHYKNKHRIGCAHFFDSTET